MSTKKTEFVKCMSPKFRASFAQVFTPKSMEGSTVEKYSVVMLFDKEAQATPEYKAMKAAAKKKLVEKFGADEKKWPANLKNPFRSGAEKSGKYEGYTDDVIFVTASSLAKNKPGIVDNNRQDIISEEGFYSGCYARATINPYAYSKAGNNGVAFGLLNIQKLGDGEPFSGKTAAKDDFEAVEVESDFASNDDNSEDGDSSEW